jgi:nitrate/nitrite transporter NarK
MTQAVADRGPLVVAAGTGINLALGVLYTWSVFKAAIKQSIEAGGAGAFRWDPATLNDPYAVCLLVFAFMMVPAGRMQDRLGPRITALSGGVLVGAGFLWVSGSREYWDWILGFGVLVGTGIAFGYSAATPVALRWFPPTRTGRITGIVVSGFGLASVYIAPLASWLLGRWGLGGAMQVLGVAFLLVVALLSLLLVNPPPGHTPKGFVERRGRIESHRRARGVFPDADEPPSRVLRLPAFWVLWVLYFVGAGAGLMVIGSMAGMAQSGLGERAFLAVVILAVGNAAGRVAAGAISDRIGRKRTLSMVFALQAVLMFLAVPVVGSGVAHAIPLLLLATLIGFNYGANLTLFPSCAKDLWGIRHFGVNYGLLFTAWGVGGFVLSRASEMLRGATGSFTASFAVAGALLLAGLVITLLFSDSKDHARCELRRRERLPVGVPPP